MKVEDKLKFVQNSDEIMTAVKILIAAFDDCELNSHIRFTYERDGGKKYELTFLYLPNEIKYKVDNAEVSVGDTFKLDTNKISGTPITHLSVGNTYEVEKVKHNYRCLRIAIAVRGDDMKLRWYSFDSIKKRWVKV